MPVEEKLGKKDKHNRYYGADEYTRHGHEEITEPEHLQIKEYEVMKENQNRGVSHEPGKAKYTYIGITAGFYFFV